MKNTAVTLCLLLISLQVSAQGTLRLGNDSWPPFIFEDGTQGTARELVCTALERVDYRCDVLVYAWEKVLTDAREGEIDGIAAAWKTPEREEFLLFSKPYLTNRIMPVLHAEAAIEINSADDLAGLKVALAKGYAYGEELDALRETFTTVDVVGGAEALAAVHNRHADVALMDELVARQLLAGELGQVLFVAETVITSRDLHFAMSRENPEAAAVISLFNTAYSFMIQEGVVNEILNVDWLATDLGNDGRLDLILRNGVSLADLSNPSAQGSTYALGSSDYQSLNHSNFDYSQANYQVAGESHSDVESALGSAFGKDKVCQHEEWTSTVRCDIEQPSNR